jgi:hypothetical protein
MLKKAVSTTTLPSIPENILVDIPQVKKDDSDSYGCDMSYPIDIGK